MNEIKEENVSQKVVVLDEATHDALKQLSKETGFKLYALANEVVNLGIEAYKVKKDQ